MAQKILLKRSNTTGNYPTSSQIEIGELAINTYDGSMFMKLNDGSSSVIALHHNQALHYDTSNDRVGIGTTSPGRQLHVQMPNLAAGTGNGIRITDDSALMEVGIRKDGSGNRRLAIFEDGGTYPLVLQEDGGKVGVGVTNPTWHFSVFNNASIYTASFDGQNNTGIVINSSVGYSSIIGYSADNSVYNDIDIRANSNGNGRIYLDGSTGYVGIGTAAPGVKLDIESANNNTQLELTATDGTNQSHGIFTATGNNSNGAGFYIQDKTASGSPIRLKINTSGAITFNSAYTFPTADGSANQVLQTDGSGNLSFADVSSGGGVTISNNANNRVLTGDGTNANAEANLTFNGSTLNVTGGITATGTIKTDLIQREGDSLSAHTFIDFDMDSGASSGTNNLVLGAVNNMDFLIDTNNNSTTGAFVFGTNATSMGSATELMRLDESGKLGIGTTAPTEKLHVEGNIELQNDGYIGSLDGNYWQRIRFEDDTPSSTNAFNFETRNGSGSFINHMTITNNGDVGINKTSPSYKLDVGGNIHSTAAYIDGYLYHAGDTDTHLLFGTNDIKLIAGGATHFNAASDQKTHIYGGNSIALTAHTNQNIGIGTTTPSSKLTVIGDTRIEQGDLRIVSGNKRIRGSVTNTNTTGTIIQGTISDHSVEQGGDIDLSRFNILAGADKRYTVTVTKAGSSSSIGSAVFRAGSNNGGSTTMANATDEFVITIDLGSRNITYTAYVGVVFGNENFRARGVKIETYRNGAYQTECDLTNQTENIVARQVNGNNGNGVSKVRFTFKDPVNTSGMYFRINNLFLINYNTGVYTDGYDVDRYDDVTKYGHLTFRDNSNVKLGNGGDMTLHHDGTNSYIQNNTGDLYIQNLLDDGDVKLQCDDGSGGLAEYIRLDGSDAVTKIYKTMIFQDNVKGSFGNSEDMRIKHDGTDSFIENYTGNLEIRNNTDDGDINFRSDNGSGGLTTYFSIDGGGEYNRFYKNAYFTDSVKALFGTSSDLQIYHDGSNSYIKDGGTGNLRIDATDFYVRNSAGTQLKIGAIDSGAVNLYYAGSKKFETTSAGGTITGALTVTGDLNVQGSTTTISTATLDVEDKNITLNKGSGDTSSTADGAGITIQDAVDASNDATFTWDATNDRWDLSHSLEFTDNDMILWSGNSILQHTGSYTYLGDSASGSSLRLTGGRLGISRNPGSSYHLDVNGAGRFLGPNSAPQLLIENTGAAGGNSAQIKFKPTSSRDAGPFIMSTQRGNASTDGDIQIGDENGTIATFNVGRQGLGTISPKGTLEIYNTNTVSDGDGSADEGMTGGDSIILYGHGGSLEQNYGSIVWTNGGTRRRAMIAAVAENADTDHVGLAFYTQGTDGSGDFFESMRITRGGDVCIGNSSAGAKLDLRKDSGYAIRAENGSGHYFRVAAGGAIEVGGSAFVDASRNITSGTITSSGNIDVNSDSGQLQFGADNDMQIFHNGAGGEINNATGNFTIDSVGDIDLDADGGDVKLKDAGTTYGILTNSSGNLRIKSGTTTAITFSGANTTFNGNISGSSVADFNQFKATVAGSSSSGVNSFGLFLENPNDNAFTADALAAYNASTSWDQPDKTTFAASSRGTGDSIFTYMSDNNGGSAGVVIDRIVQLSGSNTGYHRGWDYYHYDGSGNTSNDFKDAGNLWRVRNRVAGSMNTVLTLTTNTFTLNGSGVYNKALTGDASQLTINNTAGATLRMGITGSGANQNAHIKTNASEALEFHIGQAANAGTPDIEFLADGGGIAIQGTTFVSSTRNVTANAITASGNVGIGTTNPSNKLHLASSSDYEVYFDHTGTGGETFRLSHGTSGLYMRGPDTTNIMFGWTQDHDVKFYNSSAQQYLIGQGSTGRIGIGPGPSNSGITPEALVEIYSNVDGDATNLLVMNQKTYGTGTGTNERATIGLGIAEASSTSLSRLFGTIHVRTLNETDSSHGLLSFGVRAGGSIIDDVLVLRGGASNPTSRVGIGTNNPGFKLDVASGALDFPARFVSSDAKAGIVIADSVSTSYVMATGGKTSIGNTSSDSANNLTITSTGKVGFGETSPVHLVEAKGTDAALIAHYNGQSRGGVAALSGQLVGFLSTSTNDDLVFGHSGNPVSSGAFNEKMRIDNGTGHVSIGTSAAGGRKLDILDNSEVNGEIIKIQGNNSYGAVIHYARGSSYSWEAGIGGGSSQDANIPSSYWGIGERAASGRPARFLIAHTSGNVGINATPQTSGSTKLRIGGTGDPHIRIEDFDGTNQYVNLGHNGGDTTYVSRNNTSHGTHSFYSYNGTSTTLRFKLNANGTSTFNNAFTLPSTDGSANQVLITNGSGTVSWGAVTASNADTVDNLHASSFLRSDAADTAGSKITFGAGLDISAGSINYLPNTGAILQVDGQNIIERMTENGGITIGHDDAVIIAAGDTSGVMNTNISNATETVFLGAEGGFIAYAFPNNDTSWSNRKSFSFDGANGLNMNSVFTVDINGNLSATTKSFDIPHPSKEGMRLRHGVLEGPENGVYVRGKSQEKVIPLPEYWPDLIHEDSITVQLTAIGSGQELYVEKIEDNKVYVNGDNYFYYIQAERKDVDRFEVEYEG